MQEDINKMIKQKYVAKSIVLFVIAAMYRCLFGVIFLGGIDVRLYSYLSWATINNSLPTSCPYLNYFPLEALFWWFAGWLHVNTPLPFAFCFKVIPIFFDSLLAVLLFAFMQRQSKKYAFVCGLLYALSPISMIIDCMHGQWESLFLFFFLLSIYIRDFYTDSFKKYVVVSFLFALSFLMRTVSLAFIAFVFIPHEIILRIGWVIKKVWKIIFLKLIIGLCSIGVVIAIFLKTTQLELNQIFISFFHFILSPSFIMCSGFLALILLSTIFLCAKRKSTTKEFKSRLSVNDDFNIYIQNQIVLAGGIIFVTCIALLFFVGVMHIDLHFLIDTILRCLNKGTQVMGLPLAWPFFKYDLLKKIIINRVWVMLIIGWLTVYYYQKKLTTIQAVLISFIFMMGFLGLSTSYLVWPIVFILLEGHYGFMAVYNFFVMNLLLLFYANPFSDPRQGCEYVNVLGFAILKGFKWLMPPSFLLDKKVTFYIRLLGNYIIPLLCILFFFYLIRKMLKSPAKQPSNDINKQTFVIFKNGFLSVCSLLSLVIMAFIMITNHAYLLNRFEVIKSIKMLSYDIQYINGLPPLGVYGDFSWFNIIFILFFITIVWSSIAMWLGVTSKQKE